MNRNAHVHIGMPVFNGETYLAQAIESLLNQTHENFDIFLVDNASTDGTSEIAKAYAEKDKRLNYLRMTDWVCAIDNWRRTFELAAPGANFFMWASHDDLRTKQYIERLLPPLLDQPEVVVSFSQIDQMDSEGKVVDHLYRDRHPGGKTALQRIRSIISCGRYSAIYGLMRTQVIRRNVSLSDTCFGADLWFLIQLATVGQFHMIREPLFFKRAGGISVTRQDPSASNDPASTWNIGDKEWKAISQLKTNLWTKLSTFYTLRAYAKIHVRDRRLDWFMYPVFYYYLLRYNYYLLRSRAFGIRSRLKQFAAEKL